VGVVPTALASSTCVLIGEVKNDLKSCGALCGCVMGGLVCLCHRRCTLSCLFDFTACGAWIRVATHTLVVDVYFPPFPPSDVRAHTHAHAVGDGHVPLVLRHPTQGMLRMRVRGGIPVVLHLVRFFFFLTHLSKAVRCPSQLPRLKSELLSAVAIAAFTNLQGNLTQELVAHMTRVCAGSHTHATSPTPRPRAAQLPAQPSTAGRHDKVHVLPRVHVPPVHEELRVVREELPVAVSVLRGVCLSLWVVSAAAASVSAAALLTSVVAVHCLLWERFSAADILCARARAHTHTSLSGSFLLVLCDLSDENLPSGGEAGT
jgi:hypothetical protein